MAVVKEFNGLNGTVVTRKRIQRMIDLAKKENETAVIYRLSKILNDNPDTNKFELIIKKYSSGLNAAHHAGVYKEALDNCGRLKPGYKFENGAVIKVQPKQKRKSVADTKPKAEPKKLQPKKAAVKKINPVTKPKPASSKKDAVKTAVKPQEKVVQFVLTNLPVKYDKAIYTSSIAELKGYATRTEEPLSSAAKNMLDLINEKLFDLLYFKDGYGRQNAKATYRNVPTVYSKLYKKDIERIDVIRLEYLLEKYKEYQYKTAWLAYSFQGKPSREIYNTVKANIRTIERTLLTLKEKKSKPKANPVTKPKSVSIRTAIKDVLSTSKYPGINIPETQILYNHFELFTDPEFDSIELAETLTIGDKYSLKILKDFSYYYDLNTNNELEITEKGKNLIKSVKNRVESVNNKKYNHSLFPGLNGSKKKPVKKIEKSKGLNAIVPEQCKPASKNPRVLNIGAAGDNTPSEFYTVLDQEGEFLQAVEKKPVHSVVITMDGEQGAGKTTTLYKFMNAFAEPGNRCLFISGEEHPASSLAKDKVDKYLSQKAQANIDTVAEVKDMADLYDLIKDYEIIFIDSWQKLQRMVKHIRLDEDLRKKFDGKVFVIIFQQTTTGRTKGGSEVVFDGDIIIKMVKEATFADNYAFFDKNRYTKIPIETIRYNIASGKVYNPLQKTEPETVATESCELNFEVV